MADQADSNERKTLNDLLAVMAALRTPGSGCPWDLEQDFKTIAPYTIEEAYEVADAIARADLADLKEELGDLLLQVVYHAQLAAEQHAFTFADVVHGIATKMVRRHPHVFGDETARSCGVAVGFWEQIKAAEKAEKAAARAALAAGPANALAPEVGSLLDDVPLGLPALTRAIKLQHKAARVGFDWPSLGPVLDKMKEELAELEAAIAAAAASGEETPAPEGTQPQPSGTADSAEPATAPAQHAALDEELGDLLFVLANVARHLKIDPETALRRANEKFCRRFRYIEARLAGQGRTTDGASLQEMDGLWNEVRAADKGEQSPA